MKDPNFRPPAQHFSRGMAPPVVFFFKKRNCLQSGNPDKKNIEVKGQFFGGGVNLYILNLRISSAHICLGFGNIKWPPCLCNPPPRKIWGLGSPWRLLCFFLSPLFLKGPRGKTTRENPRGLSTKMLHPVHVNRFGNLFKRAEIPVMRGFPKASSGKGVWEKN